MNAGLDPWETPDWGQCLASAEQQIEYAPALAEAITAEAYVDRSLDISGRAAAIHLRAGDIIFGRHRMHDRFHFKCCPYPVARHILPEEQMLGSHAIIFGQDAGLINYLTQTSDAFAASDLAK